MTPQPAPEPQVAKHHWINTIIGILDGAYWLTDEEQFFTVQIVSRLLDDLSIPDRGEPADLPAPLALEVASSYYTIRVAAPQDADTIRAPRLADGHDIVVSVDTWREALLRLLRTAYPDLEPLEILHAGKTLTDLLVAIGLPDRAAAAFPEDVVRAFLDTN